MRGQGLGRGVYGQVGKEGCIDLAVEEGCIDRAGKSCMDM